MNCGLLWVIAGVEWSGCGWRCAGAPARSSRMPWGHAMTPPPGSFGPVSHLLSVKAYCIRIIWRAITTSCLPASIRPATPNGARLITLSALTIPCASACGWLVSTFGTTNDKLSRRAVRRGRLERRVGGYRDSSKSRTTSVSRQNTSLLGCLQRGSRYR